MSSEHDLIFQISLAARSSSAVNDGRYLRKSDRLLGREISQFAKSDGSEIRRI
jgi:hypothetical protein